jgi:hypothetical protein
MVYVFRIACVAHSIWDLRVGSDLSFPMIGQSSTNEIGGRSFCCTSIISTPDEFLPRRVSTPDEPCAPGEFFSIPASSSYHNNFTLAELRCTYPLVVTMAFTKSE